MKWSPQRKHIDRLEKKGRPLPADYLDRPLLAYGARFLWDAFWELTTERPMGFGAEGRIPYTAIRLFAHDHSLAGDAAGWFRTVIREMDAEYLGIRAPTAASQIVNETPMNDVKGVRGLLRRHAKQSNSAGSPAAS